MSGITFLLIFAITIILFFKPQSFSENSFTTVATNTAFYVSFLAAVIGIYIQNRIERSTYGKLWPAFAVVLGITCGFIGNILGRFFAYIIIGSLKDIVAMPVIASCLISLLCGTLCYLSGHIVFRLNQLKYILLVLATFFFGFFASVIMTHNNYWWKSSICTLGMPSSKNYEIYNYTLIIFGISLIVFAAYLRPLMKSLLSKKIMDIHKIKTLTILYFLGMIDFALIGAVPYGIYSWMNPVHVFMGSFVFYVISLIMFLSFWLFSKFSRNFVRANYVLLLICALSYSIGFYTKLLPFSYAEIAMTIAVLTWVALLIIDLKKINSLPNEEMITAQTSIID